MPVTIRVVPGCKTKLPVLSNGENGGRIVIREEFCQLPRGHDGPHRGASGGWLENIEGNIRLTEQGKL